MKGANELRGLFTQAVKQWIAHEAPTRSAAIAFYSLTSLAPISVLMVWIGATAWERGSVRANVLRRLTESLGPEAASLVAAVLNDATLPGGDAVLPAIFGFVVFVLSATAVLGQLQDALRAVWEVPGGTTGQLSGFLRQRGLGLLLVGVLGVVLFASMSVTVTMAALAELLPSDIPTPLLGVADFGVFAVTLIVLFTLVLRILPDADVPWREAALGGVVTGLLHLAGQSVVGLYLSAGGFGSAYGAAASLVVFLSWIYYSSLVFLLGAEVTRALSVDRPTMSPREAPSTTG